MMRLSSRSLLHLITRSLTAVGLLAGFIYAAAGPTSRH